MAFTNQEKRNIKALRAKELPDARAYAAKANLSGFVLKGRSDDFYGGFICALNALAGLAFQIHDLGTVMTGAAVIAQIAADQIPESSLVEEEEEEGLEEWLNELEGMLERAV